MLSDELAAREKDASAIGAPIYRPGNEGWAGLIGQLSVRAKQKRPSRAACSYLERKTRFELATFSLARRLSREA